MKIYDYSKGEIYISILGLVLTIMVSKILGIIYFIYILVNYIFLKTPKFEITKENIKIKFLNKIEMFSQEEIKDILIFMKNSKLEKVIIKLYIGTIQINFDGYSNKLKSNFFKCISYYYLEKVRHFSNEK